MPRKPLDEAAYLAALVLRNSLPLETASALAESLAIAAFWDVLRELTAGRFDVAVSSERVRVVIQRFFDCDPE